MKQFSHAIEATWDAAATDFAKPESSRSSIQQPVADFAWNWPGVEVIAGAGPRETKITIQSRLAAFIRSHIVQEDRTDGDLPRKSIGNHST
ncbi:hypothetical protein [Rhizobium rhizogenes]|uniref:hypothetical protein n=1 Tax=Rhizobium rhizogenes TaxID=359 RepID=UPI0022706A23|nr:hypothetical protein [Rhizobium rhizogenes]